MSKAKPITDAELDALEEGNRAALENPTICSMPFAVDLVGRWPDIRARITELKELAEHQDRCIACREGEIEEEQKVVKRLSARIAELETRLDHLHDRRRRAERAVDM